MLSTELSLQYDILVAHQLHRQTSLSIRGGKGRLLHLLMACPGSAVNRDCASSRTYEHPNVRARLARLAPLNRRSE